MFVSSLLLEGLDLEVLMSNDWDMYNPSVILVEDKTFRKKLSDSDVYKYLIGKDYVFHSYMDITLIMHHKNFKANT